MSDIIVKKYTDLDLARRAIEITSRGVDHSKATLDMIYRWEHSPIRTQMFWIEMLGIPTFVSVHTVRHKIWMEHFVLSNREDRGGSGVEDRFTPVDHGIWTNAQALISMAQARLCYAAHPMTQQIMKEIRKAISVVDPDLANYLVPYCVYRNGVCKEPKPCGNYKVTRYDPKSIEERIKL